MRVPCSSGSRGTFGYILSQEFDHIMCHLWSNYVFMQSSILICRPDNVTWRPFGCLEGKKMLMTSQSEQKVYLEKSLSQGIQLESQPKNDIFIEMT